MAEALAIKEAEAIVSKVMEYKKLFAPLKPDLRNLRLDYRSGDAEMTMHLYVPIGKGRITKKVIVPDVSGFSIVEMYDGVGNRIDRHWKRTSKGLTLSARGLPKDSEHFLLRARGEIPSDGLRYFVETDISTDPFDLKGEDVYWISCALTEMGIEAWKRIYKELMIQNVFMSVRVGIRGCFTTTIPHPLRLVLEARQELDMATSSGDRNRISRARYRMKGLKRVTSKSEKDIVDAIGEMIARPLFHDYVYATDPFKVGQLQGEEWRLSAIPNSMTVEAFTDLGYEQRKATGNLCFRREEYKNDVGKRMNLLLD